MQCMLSTSHAKKINVRPPKTSIPRCRHRHHLCHPHHHPTRLSPPPSSAHPHTRRPGPLPAPPVFFRPPYVGVEVEVEHNVDTKRAMLQKPNTKQTQESTREDGRRSKSCAAGGAENLLSRAKDTGSRLFLTQGPARLVLANVNKMLIGRYDTCAQVSGYTYLRVSNDAARR